MRISDWSSDVCSSDLGLRHEVPAPRDRLRQAQGDGRGRENRAAGADRKSVVLGKSVSVRVDLGGRRIITKKNPRMPEQHNHIHELLVNVLISKYIGAVGLLHYTNQTNIIMK